MRLCTYNLLIVLLVSLWGEGFGVAMDTKKISSEMKTHGLESKEVYEPNQAKTSRAVKRSYKRAMKRIAIHGYTWYKGRLLHGATSQTPPSPAPKMTNQSPPRRVQRQRLTCLTWNAGGLAAHTWDAFQAWLISQHIDIILIQESHWTSTMEWTQDRYHCIHSSMGCRRGGLLTLIAKHVCSEADIGWNELEPGRVLHVRLHGPSNCIDVLNVYQHVGSSQNLEARDQIWQLLNQTFQDFLHRNQLILGGDFNCSLLHRSAAVGQGMFHFQTQRQPGTQHADVDNFHSLLKTNNLQALNTWSQPSEATFENGEVGSRIDFLCCKRLHSDQTARDVRHLHLFPLLPDTGPRHIPLMTSIQRNWYARCSTTNAQWTRRRRLDLHQRWMRDSNYADILAQNLNQKINTLSSDSIDHSLATLHDTMNSITVADTPLQRVGKYHYAQGLCQRLHWHLKQLRTRFEKHFELERIAQVFKIAAQAEQAHDRFQLYEAIRTLSPKTYTGKVQLRATNGTPLAPDQAADLLQSWFTDLYSDTGPALNGQPTSWQFTTDEFAQGLYQLPGLKALAPAYAPATLWKTAAWDVAPLLQPCIESWSLQAHFPAAWSTGDLSFLPKPGKKSQHPSALRPIALLEPMGLIAAQILDEAWTHLCALPQLAYLPGRGCFEAIRIMATHCEKVRTLLHNNRYPVHRKASGLAVPAAHGGIMISLDMTKAFDMVPRHLLFDGLQHCGVSDSVQNILKSIYQHTTFSFTHRGEHRHFTTSRGIRQGCKAAPILWSCFAGLLLGKISDALTWAWMITHILMYADDITLYELLNHPDDVKLFLQNVGIVFDILEEHGMVINMNKTLAICRLTGSQIQRIQKTFIKRTLDGTFLVVPRRNREPTLIRIVTTIPYLGVALSYDNFEMQTLNLRVQSSNRAQFQLHKWLHCEGQLTPHQRAKIWRQCVQSCLHYGLFAVGLTETGLRKLFSISLKHLRRIFKEPVFVERISHLAFLERHHLPHPLVLLHELGLKHYGRAVQKLSQLDSQDVLRHIDPDHLYQTLQLIHNYLHSITNTTTTTMLTLLCPHCDRIFADHRLLRSHLTQCHGHSGGQLRQNSVIDLDRGLPTRQRCKTKFTTWHNFRYHIDFVCTFPTQVDDLALADHEHRLRIAELLHLAAGTDLQALREHPALCAYFTQCCALCGMVCLSQRAFLQHYGTSHSTIFQQHGPVYDRLRQPWQDLSPCRLCGHEFQQRHECILVRQVAMLLTTRADADNQRPADLNNGQSTWPCPHCQQVYTTKHGLQMHLKRYHRAFEAPSSASPRPDVRIHDMITQAVILGDCATLLDNPDILRVLSLRCHVCEVDFPRKQYLRRHFRTHHSQSLNSVERDALTLDRRHRQQAICYCVPEQKQKHICLPFLQYVLSRRQHIAEERADELHRLPALTPGLTRANAGELTDVDEPALIPEHYIPTPLPLQSSVTVVDLVALTLTFGQMDIFAMSRQLRTELTLTCQICAASFTSGDLLLSHLKEDHSTDVAASERHVDLLHWTLFKDNGCICNPGVPWNTKGHHCVGLTQIAILNARTNHGILVPWAYKASDVVAVLHTLMDPALMLKTALTMIARQFDQLTSCEALRSFLQQTCVVCGTPLHAAGFEHHFYDQHHSSLGYGPELIQD